jgi:hypothetical protein
MRDDDPMTQRTAQQLGNSVSPNFRRFHEYHPPRPWRPTDELPSITDLPSLRHVRRRLDDRLKDYLDRPRAGYQTLRDDLRVELMASNADLMFAGNAEAGIRFAEILQDQIQAFGFASLAPHQWITVTPAEFVLPLDRAHEFQPQALIQIIREALRDVPAVGMVEAGHYIKWGPEGPSLQDHGSWHAHIITGEHSRAELQPFVRRMSKRKSMRGRSAVWIESIEPELVVSKLLYAAKVQTKSYRMRRMPDKIDSDGVISERYEQTKDWIGTGDHVRMIAALRGRYLPDLIFGNAAGTQLARAVRYTAMLPFCRWAERQNVSAEYAGRAIPYPIARTYQNIGNRLARETGFVP